MEDQRELVEDERGADAEENRPDELRPVALADRGVGEEAADQAPRASSTSAPEQDRKVVAVEPSSVMIAQRPPGSAPAIQAGAEQLPFADDSFDAAMAVLTLHHWTDVGAGLAEMTRVARDRIVVVTFDPQLAPDQWIVRDYLPEALREAAAYPSIGELPDALPTAVAEPVPVPRDCTDRMFYTLCARPEEHLDPRIRAATSTWQQVSAAAAARALEQLGRDLASGSWNERYGHLRERSEQDAGLRLLRAELGRR